MGLGDVVDELLDQHGLTDTGTTEETNLSTTSVRSEEVDDLDTSLQNLGSGRLLNECRWVVVDGEELVALDRTTLVNGLTNDVHDTAKRALADGNLDGGTSVDDLLATDETLGTVHGNGTDGIFTKVSRDLKDKTTTMVVLDFERVENGRERLGVELNIDDGTDDSLDVTNGALSLGRVGAGFADEHGSRHDDDEGQYVPQYTT